MKFNEKIVVLRKIKGITQDELASAVGVSRQAVYKWECGQSYPEVAKLLELKLLFGISIDDLLDESFEIALPEKKKRKRLPKSEMMSIEKEVRESLIKESIKEEKPEETAQAPAEESAAEPEVRLEAAVAAAVTEEPAAKKDSAPEAQETVEQEIVEQKATEQEAPAQEPITAPAEPTEKAEESEKKKGFFGRLFGRK